MPKHACWARTSDSNGIGLVKIETLVIKVTVDWISVMVFVISTISAFETIV